MPDNGPYLVHFSTAPLVHHSPALDKWERGPVVDHPCEYIPVAAVKLQPGVVDLSYNNEILKYELGCDKGHFSAQQVICGDAGEAVEVGLWLQEPDE